MATRRGPRFKECRRFGINVCGHPKALDRLGTTVKRNKKCQNMVNNSWKNKNKSLLWHF